MAKEKKTGLEILEALSPFEARMLEAFIKALKGREKVLPKKNLHHYLGSILQKRRTFIESADRFGSPQYFYDEPALVARAVQFHEVFLQHFKRFRMFYAMKSNSFRGMCSRMVASGIGLDVSSGFELFRALDWGCSNIIFSGPGKTDEELRLAIANKERVTILIDSVSELERLSTLAAKGGDDHKISIGVRVHGRNTGTWNKFGVSLKDLPAVFSKAYATGFIKPAGIQFHTSWNLESGAQIAMINEIGSFIRNRFPKNLWEALKFLDIGGGYWPEEGEWLNPENTLKGNLVRLLDPSFKFNPVQYYRKSVSLEHFAREISRAILLQGPPLNGLEIWAEPGRWLSHPAMHILLKVIDMKGRKKVITDGGTSLLGWERPLTEFIPIINLTNPSYKRIPCMIFGSLCTPHDIWGTAFFGEKIAPGDVLVVPNQGAYTYSLRQSFIKPKSRVVHFDGAVLSEIEKGESYSCYS